MATFPDGNPGVWPIDPASAVGQFRYTYGDIAAVPYAPVEPGYRDFEELADAEIEAFIAQGGESVPRAIGYLYLAMSGQAAKKSLSVADYDLKVDLTKRAADLRATADMWFSRADEDDLIAGEDAFVIVPTGKSCGDAIPEAAPGQWGRVYGVGRVC